jgi:dolichol-phosphate mannosyltransferase
MKHVILIPTFNESENIEKLVSTIFDLHPDIYIKVIDDNSPDKTGDVVMGLLNKFPNLSLISRHCKEGLGKAYIHGFKEVLADTDATHVIMMDADFSHDPKYLKDLIEKSNSFHVVTGSRYVKGGETVGWETWRKVLSFGGNLYCRLVTRMPVKDCTAGFNVISLEVLRKINFESLNMSGYAFIMELKYALHKAGARFYEVPIVFTNRIGGESKMSGHIISEGVMAPIKMVLGNKDKNKKSVDLEIIDCVWCENKNAEFFTHKNNHKIYKCNECKMLFVSPLPDLVEVYDQDYFAGAGEGFGYVDYDKDKEPMIPTFNKYLDLLVGKKEPTDITLLDVGAATGFFMSLAEARGFSTTGIEISDFAASLGRQKRLNIITGDLLKAPFMNGYFDVVTMCDVLEHVTDPKAILLETKRILKPEGLLLINTPDAESVVARMFGKNWHLLVPPEHLHYFSPKNLSKFLEKIGFEIVINTTIGKKFTLSYVFNMLYKWQKLSIWNYFADKTSKGFLSKIYLPINLYDNFFIIARKK